MLCSFIFEGVGGRGDGNGEGTVNENKVTWPRMQLLKNLPQSILGLYYLSKAEL